MKLEPRPPPLGEGSYKYEYVPHQAGVYLLAVRYKGPRRAQLPEHKWVPIPRSPFHVEVARPPARQLPAEIAPGLPHSRPVESGRREPLLEPLRLPEEQPAKGAASELLHETPLAQRDTVTTAPASPTLQHHEGALLVLACLTQAAANADADAVAEVNIGNLQWACQPDEPVHYVTGRGVQQSGPRVGERLEFVVHTFGLLSPFELQEPAERPPADLNKLAVVIIELNEDKSCALLLYEYRTRVACPIRQLCARSPQANAVRAARGGRQQ